MMPLPALAAGKIVSAIGIKGGIIIALALALGIALWWSQRVAEQRDEARAALALAEAEMKLLRTDAGLKEIAAEERQADTAAVAQVEKELIDAIQEVPDEQPDAVRVRLGCERLRRAGRLDADLPAVCGLGGGSQASPAG